MNECDFCAGKLIHPKYVGEGIRTMMTNISFLLGMDHEAQCDGIHLENGNLLSWDNSSGEYAEMSCEIKFCPFCGRELAGAENAYPTNEERNETPWSL